MTFSEGATGHFLRFDPPLSSLEANVPRPSYGSQGPVPLRHHQQFGQPGYHSAADKPKEIKMETVEESFDEDSGPSGIDPVIVQVHHVKLLIS